MFQHDRFIPDSHLEFAFVMPCDLELSFALIKINRGRGATAGEQAEFGKCYCASGRHANRTAIFKLNLGPSIAAGTQLIALNDGNVERGIFKSRSLMCELNIASNVT